MLVIHTIILTNTFITYMHLVVMITRLVNTTITVVTITTDGNDVMIPILTMFTIMMAALVMTMTPLPTDGSGARLFKKCKNASHCVRIIALMCQVPAPSIALWNQLHGTCHHSDAAQIYTLWRVTMEIVNRSVPPSMPWLPKAGQPVRMILSTLPTLPIK